MQKQKNSNKMHSMFYFSRRIEAEARYHRFELETLDRICLAKVSYLLAGYIFCDHLGL